jgi:hypothetical protein
MDPITRGAFGLKSGGVRANMPRLLSVPGTLFQKGSKVCDHHPRIADPANRLFSGRIHCLLSALDGRTVERRHESIPGLSTLCCEFDFSFATLLFRRSMTSRLEAQVAQK